MHGARTLLLLLIAIPACVPPARQTPPSNAPAPTLRIIGTSDFHGALESRPGPSGKEWGGAVAMAGAIKRARDECTLPSCYSILIDAGDEFQGQAVSTIARGKPVTAIFNTLRFDVAALGNHDLDWGRDTLKLRTDEAHYPMLSANIRTTDGRSVSWIKADTILRRGPFVIGVIGIMTTEANTAIAAKNIVGLRFADPAPIVDSLADALRTRGANVVIILAHAGGRCDASGVANCHGEILDVARRLTRKVDVIIGGHSHELMNTTVNNIPITVARTAGQAVDVVDVTLDRGVTRHDVRLAFVDSLPRDTAIARTVAAAIEAAGPKLKEPVATLAEDINRGSEEAGLSNLVTDAMRAAGHGDFAATNETGIRAPLRAGVVTYGNVFDVQPFGNQLVAITASGASMRRYFELMTSARGSAMRISGTVVTVDTTRPLGSRVTRVTLPNGRELDDAAKYTIVITDFLATGGLGMAFPDSSGVTTNLGIADLDATIAYLRGLPQPVRAPHDKRWRMTGAAPKSMTRILYRSRDPRPI